MITAFGTALSALQGDEAAVSVIGNNLANMNTTGYKETEVEFSNLMSQVMGFSGNSEQLGLGIGPILTQTQYAQGNIQTTNGATDAAINGSGFFVVTNQSGQTLYTRAGDFQVAANGNLETPTGEVVQGWTASNGKVDTSSAIGNITLPLGGTVPASATTTMSINANLDATPASATTPSTFSAPIQVYDSLGTSHTLTATFTETTANTWSYSVTVPSADLKSGGTTPVATGTLNFNSSGTLSSPTATGTQPSIKISGLADGAADMNITWNLFDSSGNSTITQLAQASGVSATNQNGYAAGQVSSVGIQNGGTIVANYTNGQQSVVGQLALASITNPQSLISVGNNELEASAITSQAALGTAGSAGRGQIVGGALESSTVDMATQLTDLLQMQSSYQAASKVITTSDQMLQATTNLVPNQ
jgi:flagellar hook protein FlgE